MFYKCISFSVTAHFDISLSLCPELNIVLTFCSPFNSAKVQKVEGDPPPLWGAQSDEIGKSILAILQKDPRKFDHVAGRLHGRQLPGSLRSYIWSDVLFKEERNRLKEV